MTDFPPHLMVFGPGYSASAILQQALAANWRVTATSRRPETSEQLAQMGVHAVDGTSPEAFEAAVQGLPPVTHVLTSVAPGPGGDPILALAEGWLEQQKTINWIGYLSSTNVYGDRDGGWVDEDTAPDPGLERGQRRVEAEGAWRRLADRLGADLHIFRLAGIYGPGRNAIRSVLDGKARRIVKPGQVFSRIHVADIAGAVWLAMNSGLPSEIFNMADNEPAPPGEVIDYAARLLGVEPPAEEDFETADLSPMARSFYLESKRVRNGRVKILLGYRFRYPDYKMALQELLPLETGA
ncbi:MAG: SDR family oxidoreductase [Alphaproteobacteria bacterium]|nr:MAG: SDR family oxidoreductase [Alphaproteobacteria bacterium]